MKLDGQKIWDGSDTSPPTDTSADPGWLGGSATSIGPGVTRVFDIDFDDPDNLDGWAAIADFYGTTFYFAESCTLTLG